MALAPTETTSFLGCTVFGVGNAIRPPGSDSNCGRQPVPDSKDFIGCSVFGVGTGSHGRTNEDLRES